MNHQTSLTRIAADAIIAQVSAKADCDGTHYAMIDGSEVEFTAWFRSGVTGPYQDETGPRYYETDCTLIGAYGEHPETDAMIAGNRAEMVALIGEEEVTAWEDYRAEIEQEKSA